MIITIDTDKATKAADLAILQAYLDTLEPKKTRGKAGTYTETEAEKAARSNPPKAVEPAPEAGPVVTEAKDTGHSTGSHVEIEPAKTEPTSEPAKTEPEGPTMDDAVKRATQLLSDGKGDAVKSALSGLGARRVTELKPDQVAEFLEALND